jgi:hypothetical protein
MELRQRYTIPDYAKRKNKVWRMEINEKKRVQYVPLGDGYVSIYPKSRMENFGIIPFFRYHAGSGSIRERAFPIRERRSKQNMIQEIECIDRFDAMEKFGIGGIDILFRVSRQDGKMTGWKSFRKVCETNPGPMWPWEYPQNVEWKYIAR